MSSDNKELLYLTGIEQTKSWFDHAVPEPTIADACVQIGCHLEETGEMLNAMDMLEWSCYIYDIANEFKEKRKHPYYIVNNDVNKTELLDSLADQIVTAIGVAHMFGFDIAGALAEVNRSNFSKFENGKPIFNDNGKIAKGRDYTPPNLEPYV